MVAEYVFGKQFNFWCQFDTFMYGIVYEGIGDVWAVLVISVCLMCVQEGREGVCTQTDRRHRHLHVRLPRDRGESPTPLCCFVLISIFESDWLFYIMMQQLLLTTCLILTQMFWFLYLFHFYAVHWNLTYLLVNHNFVSLQNSWDKPSSDDVLPAPRSLSLIT